jgi:hypothetical protein
LKYARVLYGLQSVIRNIRKTLLAGRENERTRKKADKYDLNIFHIYNVIGENYNPRLKPALNDLGTGYCPLSTP